MVSIEMVARALITVFGSGIIALLISRRYNISYIPLFIVAGILIGPITMVLPRTEARHLFNYVRVFGLVMILFTEGHNLSWKLLKRNFPTIATLDTLGLLVTALLAGWFFSVVFHAPFLIGFLYGAIISATDPATLIPLFKQYRVPQDIEITIVTESIFNDPLGIVLTDVAVAMLIVSASGGLFAAFSHHLGVYGAAVAFFLYEVIVSIILGVIVGLFGYWFIKKTRMYEFPEIEIFSLFLAFGGFLLGEKLQASGYLVATTTGIILGNSNVFAKKEDPKVLGKVIKAIEREVHFNETLADIATIFIFVLLGASLNLQPLVSNLVKGLLVAYFIMLVARPIAALPILKWWSKKEYVFISLEGPRGVVPSALAALPLTLAEKYHSAVLTTYWGEVILAVTVITVLASVLTETLWVPFLKSRLLESGEAEKTGA
ncbi:sodium:proton antiporter [Thermococcus sp.]|uniref:cation:proton antiporter n=1 Tax=Thermococcus sp. TaxID=35749 RepID=UPI00261A531C|nr:sodium:proton antiporter [Thermococcus sp.]